MTITDILGSLRECVRTTAKDDHGFEIEQIVVETPPRPELGDMALPVAFELAKFIKRSTGEKKNPRELAEALKYKIELLDFVSRADVAGAGYLNIYLDRAKFLIENVDAPPLPRSNANGSDLAIKVCVEHTSVNPNKAAHIGHVRNSVLGDTFQRILKANGNVVEVQNYIDNTGVQVADVVVGFIYFENKDLAAITELDAQLHRDGASFDYYCWDLYTKVGVEYLENAELKQRRAEVLTLIEEGGNPTAELADYVATRNVECILTTMDRLSIRYDVLPRESEILHLHFWDKAFEKMKELGVIHFESEGKQSGCWVMPFEEHTGSGEHESDKILVRSDGTVTYTGKDIAYQMWKLGILGLDFRYRHFHTYPDGQKVWMTTSGENEASENVFGHNSTVFNVIDTRQSYPQDVVRQGVAAIWPERGEEASVHLGYEMVALSPAAAEDLGFELSDDDRKKTFIEMSGRKGLGVKADDLIDLLEEKAGSEVALRHPDLDDAERKTISRQIAVGALRYFLLKFTRNTIIVFDFKEALSFEGETGCFCQYAAVRANSIFRKLANSGAPTDEFQNMMVGGIENETYVNLQQYLSADESDEIWSILLLAARLDETVAHAALAREPAILAKYTFNLAKAFNLFYHNHKIITEPDELRRAVLVKVTDVARRSLTTALATLGIEVPEKM